MADDKQKYIDYARKKEVEYSIPTNLLVGLLQTESSYNPDIISGKRRSKAGAIGIAQFMPETAKEYGIDPLNPEQSIDAAAKYLNKSYKIFNNWEDAVLSYNAGAGKVKIYKKGKPITNKEHLEYTGKVFKNANINYENSVAPYINQNIDFSNSAEGITFEEEKPEKETEATQALKVLQEKQKEEDFLTELFSEQEQKIAELYKPIEEEQDSQPQSYDYNDISNFVESPILAQQGKTIYVKSVNDPVYKAYQDSLNLYNSYRKVEKALKTQGYTTEGLSKSGSMPIKRKSGVEYEKMFTEDSDNNKNNVIKNNDGTYNVRDFENMMVNKTLPYQLFNKNIEPLHVRRYHDDNIYTYTNTPEYMEVNGIKANASPLRKDVRNVYNYSNVNPQQPVQVRPNTFKDDRGNIVTTGDNKPKGRPQLVQVLQKLEDRPDINPIQNYIQPQGIVEPDFGLRTDIDIRVPYRNPKYYDIEDYIQGSTNYTGSQTNYRTSDLSQLTQLSANNTRKIIPQYEYGGGIKIDNQGYWNPQNWGKPVQINSNNITMEGVEQPLIGYAPETGEKRLMLPNTNHIFNGANRVIETPLTEKEKQFLKEITKIK